ncbi:MAG: DUF2273 domain-containing protein [Eubacteriales bacterium]|nr:DUF2273 domain-containing protein [Eubacteriales bacterium]
MSEKEKIKNYIKAHKGVIIGMSIGFFIGALILCIGFFRTLFLGICVGIGAIFGTNNKFKKKLMEIFDRILPNIFK